MRAEELKGHLDAVLLAALEGGPRHGYAVIESLRQSTGGQLDLPTGTIYPAGDWDWFQVTFAAGSVISVSLTSNPGSQYVFDVYQDILGIHTSLALNQLGSWSTTNSGTSSVTYFIGVHAANSSAAITNPYTVRFDAG